MLKITKILRHTTYITCGCPRATEYDCGILYRAMW